ncbi:MAG: ABC transporter permease [Longimicrobiales bacterium]
MRTPALWRAALRLLPGAFRDRHAGEMEAVVASSLDGRGAMGRAWVWTRAVGDVVTTAWRIRRARVRAARGEGTRMGEFTRDLAFAARALRRRPGFAVVAVLTLAVGIGANTAIFSVVNGVLFRPLPYPDSERIGILWHEFGDGAQNLPAVHALDIRDYRDRSELFETFTMATGQEWILGEEADPEVVDVGLVEAGFFEFFGAEAAHGRTFRPEDDTPGGTPAVVLSHRLWERRFGADPEVVGRTIPIAGTRLEVVGVAPESFRLLLPGEAFRLRDAEVWVSLRLDPARQPPRNFTGYTGFGRLRPGATFAQAQAEVESMAARLRQEHPEHAASKLVARVEPLHADVVKGADRTLRILFGAVAFVLLIACANVANLVLVRGQSRSTEMALRSALGAGRSSLVRLAVMESALLSAAGVALGLVLAVGFLEAVAALGPGSVPRLDAVRLDGTVLGFAVGAGVFSAVLFGLLPALGAGSADPAGALQSGGRSGETRRHRRLRDALIVGEVAASLVLLVGTGLLIRSFQALGEADPGFSTESRLTFRTNLPPGPFRDAGAREAFHRQFRDELEALPSVERVALVSQLPLTGSGPLQPYAYDEETASNWESVTADQRFVTPAFFDAIGARLLAGRTFTGSSESDVGTIVIDDRLAARAFPGGDAVGQRLQIGPNGTPEEERYATVVGVVAHLRLHELSRPHLTQIYHPLGASSRFSVVVHASGDPEAVAPAVREVMARLAPGAPLEDLRSLEDLAWTSLAPVRLALGLMTAFGAVALLLAAVGLYGVLAYAVSRRTREIGVRMALGQAPTDVRRVVLTQGARLVALALLLGLPTAALVSRAAESLLYGVRPLDPATYVATSLVLSLVALAACWIPARRATGIDPATALRE